MVKASRLASFDVRAMGEVKYFIGMSVRRHRAAKVITLRNPWHVTSRLLTVQMDKSAPKKTPMVSGGRHFKTGENFLPEVNRYAKLVGSFMYLSTTTRPDIAFAVGVLCRFISCPEEDHMRAAKGLIQYLRGTTGLVVLSGNHKPLQVYFDTD